MANLNKIQATLNEAPSSDINLLAVNGLEIQQVPIGAIKTNSSGGTSGGGASIIYATEKPSTPQQAIYVITEDEVVKAEAVQGGTVLSSGYGYVEIVDTLPEDAHLGIYASDIYDEAVYGYYLTTNGHIYMYTDAYIASAMGFAEGWNDLTSYGIIKELYSADEYDSDYPFNVLLTKQPKTRVYVPLPDGTFLELTSGIRTRFDKNSGTVSITEM
jgi:hypothetical protein